MGGFRSPLFLFGVGGGTITPVVVTSTTPLPARNTGSPLNIRKEMAQLRRGIQLDDLPKKGTTPGAQTQFGQNLMQAFSQIQDSYNALNLQVQNASTFLNTFGLTRDPGGNIALSCATFAIRAGNQNFLLANGRLQWGISIVPPIPDDLPLNHITAHLDVGGSAIVFTVKFPDGTVKTGTVLLV